MRLLFQIIVKQSMIFVHPGQSHRIVQCILSDNLNMRCILVKSVPRLLSDEDPSHICTELKTKSEMNSTLYPIT